LEIYQDSYYVAILHLIKPFIGILEKVALSFFGIRLYHIPKNRKIFSPTNDT
jgi:hypothetical protein